MESQVSNRTEAEVIAGILAGETQLYHELIRPHERSVYRMALSFMKNEAGAEDLAQEVFVRAFRDLASFRVFLLRDVEELNINETAEVLNLSIPNVKARLHRARVMLQKRLAPQMKRTSPGSKRRWLPW